jgi:hypothetical protein
LRVVNAKVAPLSGANEGPSIGGGLGIDNRVIVGSALEETFRILESDWVWAGGLRHLEKFNIGVGSASE